MKHFVERVEPDTSQKDLSILVNNMSVHVYPWGDLKQGNLFIYLLFFFGGGGLKTLRINVFRDNFDIISIISNLQILVFLYFWVTGTILSM